MGFSSTQHTMYRRQNKQHTENALPSHSSGHIIAFFSVFPDSSDIYLFCPGILIVIRENVLTPFAEGKNQSLVNFQARYSVLASLSAFQHLLNKFWVLLALLESYKGSRRFRDLKSITIKFSQNITIENLLSARYFFELGIHFIFYWGTDIQTHDPLTIGKWNVLKVYWSNEYFSFYICT